MLRNSKFLDSTVILIALTVVTCVGFLNAMNMMGVYDNSDVSYSIASGISSLKEKQLMPIGVEYLKFLSGDDNFQSSVYRTPLLQFFLALTSGWGGNIAVSNAVLFSCIPAFLFNLFFFLIARKHCKISLLGIMALLCFFNLTPLAYSIYRPIGEPYLLALVFIAIFLIFENRYFGSGITLAAAYFFRVQALSFIPSLVFLFSTDIKKLAKYALGFIFSFVLIKFLLFVFVSTPIAGSETHYMQFQNSLSVNTVDGFIYFVKSRPVLFILFLLNIAIFALCKDQVVRKINLLCLNCFLVMFPFLYCYILFKITHVPGRYVLYYFPISTLGVATFCQYYLYKCEITRKWKKISYNAAWACLIMVICTYCYGFDANKIQHNLHMMDSDPVFNNLSVSKSDILAVTNRDLGARVYYTFLNRNIVYFQDAKLIASKTDKPRAPIKGPEFFVEADNSKIDYLFVGGRSSEWLEFTEGKDEVSDKYGNSFKLVASKIAKRQLPETMTYKMYKYLCAAFPEYENNIYSILRKFDLLPRGYEMNLYRVYERVSRS